ncbi:hypothetical protein [Paraburkholderia sp. RL17-337-BIB-A]|uniref:hypothetical protein n=1 Tax=Paraburkholderia sp. RL17-337-BIB-A TaxID=3031636 RepID=UPI0038BB2F6C
MKEQKLHETLVFPSPRAKDVSDMVLTSFLRHVQAKGDTPRRVATAHGFRSSFRDWASEQGYARDLAGGRSRMQWRIRLKRPITAPTCWNSAARCWKLGQSMLAATEPIVP